MKAVLFDRDGVINCLIDRGYQRTSPYNLSELQYMPKIFEAVQIIKDLGYKTYVITNQPDIPLCQLTIINNAIKKALGFDEIYSAVDKNSKNYKPGTGLFEKVIEEHKVDPLKSYMIGDRAKDVVAGHLTGFTTILIGDHYEPLLEYVHTFPNFMCSSTYDAALLIKKLNERK